MPRAKSKPPVLDAPQASHGERSELLRAQRETPSPPGPTNTPAATAGAPGGPPPARRPEVGDVLKMAQTQMPARGMALGDPTARPGEPITAGAPIGAGPGPQRGMNRTAKILGRLAAIGDDPLLSELAMQAEMKGL